MVQLKYFGDDRDYFKYDLITHVLRTCRFTHYGFVPMLTAHRDDNEGNLVPKPSPCKSGELLSYIAHCAGHDLNHWQTWLAGYVDHYHTVQPVNSTYIGHTARQQYWDTFRGGGAGFPRS